MAHLGGQLRVLTLNEGENLETTVFRLEKGWTLHFVLGPSLATKKVRVFVNHPADVKSGPNRHQYRELPWQNYSGSKWDVYDNYNEVPIIMGGSFNYFFTTDGSSAVDQASGRGNFLVDPVLRSGKYDEKLPLDSICCQTILTKSLGPFPEWQDRLRVAKETGYNMLHFTPIQELGASNSSYCLSDQLKLNPIFSPGEVKYTYEDVAKLVNYMKEDWEVLSLTDLVYNHTANESPWIKTHPECVFNLVNSPHLKPAFLLDRILWHLTIDVGEGRLEDKGLPPQIKTEDHLNILRSMLCKEIVPKRNIHEYYLLHIDDTLQQFRSAILSGQKGVEKPGGDLSIIPDPKFRRLKAVIDMAVALHLFNTPREGAQTEEERVNQCCHALRARLEQLNSEKYKEIQSHLEAAVENVIANARWRFLDPAGPCTKKVTEKSPIMYNYFTLPKEHLSVEREEELMHTDWGAFCMGHNGWVMNDDPLRNFAEPGSNVYLRRELIPWGDSVKLRYGKSREDCPFLWDQMRDYSVKTARIFHGVRLDNCHSTPIHVAEYMLDEARKVRPDLYVIAELFTSSETKDNIFINRLGINSLIREATKAHDSHEEGRYIHRYGGDPVGAFIQPPARPLVATMAHAIFHDVTHDNPSLVEKRSAFDLLPTSALVAMAPCATGSNRGHDELVPHHIHVVSEQRLYPSWSDNMKGMAFVNERSGIIAAKRALNKLHYGLGMTGFNQVYVDQVDTDIVSVTRHNPVSHQSVILVSHTAFHKPNTAHSKCVPPLCVPGVIDEIILEAKISHKVDGTAYKKDPKYVNGLSDYVVEIREHIKVNASKFVKVRESRDPALIELDFIDFPPGSVFAIKVSLNASIKSAILDMRSCLSSFGYRVHTYSGRNLKEISSTELESVVSGLSLNDMNRVLYRCDGEERDDGKGFGSYNIPGHGNLPYCGLQGVMSVLSRIRAKNDLGHPLCDNLRNGDWMADWMAGRLLKFPGTEGLGRWFQHAFTNLKKIPRYLIPCYFDAIVTGVFMLVEEVAWAKMGPFVSNGSTFVRALAMGSLQFCSVVKTGSLPVLSPNLAPPKPPTVQNEETNDNQQACVSIAAGLPHFAHGIMRNWGRDTFISLRGLMFLTGRFTEARFIILSFAGTLCHGLIPNLLGSGTHARFNCRDAIWWWLQCIQDYCKVAPQGVGLLSDIVTRIFPSDDSDPEPAGTVEQALEEVIQEALQRHADGVQYRERNAGRELDKNMSDEGFENEIGVDWRTGFVCGGNIHNCGTWMDKNGSSEEAGNKGKPATPRDGSAVELVGLCQSNLKWLAELYKAGIYSYEGVIYTLDVYSEEHNACTSSHSGEISFQDWSNLICANFEKFFWINTSPVPELEPKPKLINRRGIYKDSYGASLFWADYQLRPNFPIAMVVAPDMFTPENAWTALRMVENHLLGPLGMKTLDPKDWAYNGNYINSDKSHGYNYHQGPEWVWPVGYFLRAKLHFAGLLEATQPGILQATINFVESTLANHNMTLQSSEWRSLPELTNKDGAVCGDSCSAQAWSMGCILEVLCDLEKITNKIQ